MIEFSEENIFIIKSVVATLSGTTLQYLFGQKRGFKVFLFLLLTSSFFAIYMVLPIMGFMAIDDKYQPPVLASSALISVELISLITKFLPCVIKARMVKFFERL